MVAGRKLKKKCNRISDAAILDRFESTPTDMTMQMHMGMVMYAPTDELTFMAMVPCMHKSMNHVTLDGTWFAERTSGIGDIELRGLYSHKPIFQSLDGPQLQRRRVVG